LVFLLRFFRSILHEFDALFVTIAITTATTMIITIVNRRV